MSLALAYLLGHLAGSEEAYDETDTEDEEEEEQPRKRPSSSSGPDPKRQRTGSDEYDHFAQSLALQLRKLPQVEAARMMQQMQAMVSKKRIELDNKSNRRKEGNSEPFIEIPQQMPDGEGYDFYGEEIPVEDPIGSKLECTFIKEEPE